MELQKFFQRSYIVILFDLPNTAIKMLDKISFHKHFKTDYQAVRNENKRDRMGMIWNF